MQAFHIDTKKDSPEIHPAQKQIPFKCSVEPYEGLAERCPHGLLISLYILYRDCNGHKPFYTLWTGKKTGKSGMGNTPVKLWST